MEIPGRAPYDVTIRRTVHVIHLPSVQPGATIPVQVDPANPSKVRIDFGQPITQPVGWSGSPPNSSGHPLDQLSKLADLHDRGVLTDAEFEAEKRELPLLGQ